MGWCKQQTFISHSQEATSLRSKPSSCFTKGSLLTVSLTWCGAADGREEGREKGDEEFRIILSQTMHTHTLTHTHKVLLWSLLEFHWIYKLIWKELMYLQYWIFLFMTTVSHYLFVLNTFFHLFLYLFLATLHFLLL